MHTPTYTCVCVCAWSNRNDTLLLCIKRRKNEFKKGPLTLNFSAYN